MKGVLELGASRPNTSDAGRCEIAAFSRLPAANSAVTNTRELQAPNVLDTCLQVRVVRTSDALLPSGQSLGSNIRTGRTVALE
jgi:hypothetical protein